MPRGAAKQLGPVFRSFPFRPPVSRVRSAADRGIHETASHWPAFPAYQLAEAAYSVIHAALRGPRKLECQRGLSSFKKKFVTPPESVLPSIAGRRPLLLLNTTPTIWPGARLRKLLTPSFNPVVACLGHCLVRVATATDLHQGLAVQPRTKRHACV